MAKHKDSASTMAEIENEIFDKIGKSDTNGLRTLLLERQGDVDFVDENGMTPLQHACYKGNREIAQMLLDQGAKVNTGKHAYGYTALHFAALSGKVDLCQLLLESGADVHVLNSVGRTAAQMAAFVGNHTCVAVLNNFIPRGDVDYYTVPHALEKEPQLPPFLAAPLHKFIMHVNINPVRVALNLRGLLLEHITKVQHVLELMRDREAHRGVETNEVASLKFHYLSYVVAEIAKIQSRHLQQQQQQMQHEQSEEKTSEKEKEERDKKWDPVEVFVKNMLKVGRAGESHHAELQERFLRECVREYPYRESTLLRQIVTSLAPADSPNALPVICAAINGERGFHDQTHPSCCTCGEEKAPKKCSKCKAVQYCDRECQRLHWFLHKKACARLEGTVNGSVAGTGSNNSTQSPSTDSAPSQAEISNAVVDALRAQLGSI